MLRFGIRFIAIVVIGILCLQSSLASAVRASIAAHPAAAAPDSMLQFKVDDHVIGFGPSKVYFASLDHALSLEFLDGANLMPQSSANESADGIKSGHAPLGDVVYHDVWPGVNVSFTRSDDGIATSTYNLAAGTDSTQIRLRYNSPVEFQDDGSLDFALATRRGGDLNLSALTAWQMIMGQRIPVSAQYKRDSDQTVSVALGQYDPAYAVTFSSTYRWHTFLGSGEGPNYRDEGFAVAVNGGGDVFVSGYSMVGWLGSGDASPIHAHSGYTDTVVLKLNSNGVYQWHTFYGSHAGVDAGYGIAVDGSNNVYVTGYSNASWNGDSNAVPLHGYSGTASLFVLKLNGAGAYQWHTFYGGLYGGQGVAVDTNGGVYVSGYSLANWLADNNANPLHAYSGGADIAVLKLNANGVYQWHTFYGAATGSGDYGAAVAADGNHGVYITGYSFATWQGDNNTNPINAFNADAEIVVLKLDDNGVYQWHSFWGGSFDDYGLGIAVSGTSVYITGFSLIDNWGVPIHTNGSGLGNDIFVLKLNSSGQFQWNTFYGSDQDDFAYGIAANSDGVYVTGLSANWLGDNNTPGLHTCGCIGFFALKLDSNGSYQWHTHYGVGVSYYLSEYNSAYGIGVDGSGGIYVVGNSPRSWQGDGNTQPIHGHATNTSPNITILKLSSSGLYQWHTFYGAGSEDYGYAITVDDSGSIYLTGLSEASWLGPNGAAPLHSDSGGRDIVVVKLDDGGVYQWHTFYGSSTGDDNGRAIAVDHSGGIYISGDSGASWKGPGNANPLHAYSGTSAIFVLKLDSNGAYQWHTFYGSTSPGYYAVGNAITTDENANVYVTGTSTKGWQGDAGANPLHPFTTTFGKNDLFVLSLSSSGTYQWHTFYGYDGGGDDVGTGIAVDSAGDIYVSGSSWNAWQGDNHTDPLHAFGENPGHFITNLFVLKLSSAGTYRWHTFYGYDYVVDNSIDHVVSIAIDRADGVYVASAANASWLGNNGTSPLHAFSGASDFEVLKLSSDGIYQWHTFFGGAVSAAYGLAADRFGGLAIVGDSSGDWLGANNASALHPYSGGNSQDISVLRLNVAGGYRWHTFYGAADGDAYGRAIAADANGNLFIGGSSTRNWLADGGTNPIHALSGASDLVLLRMDADLSKHLFLPQIVR